MIGFSILITIRSIIAVTFLASVIGKVFSFRSFENTLGELKFFQGPTLKYVASLVIILEFLVAISMLNYEILPLGFVISIMLLVTFTAFLLYVLNNQLTMQCNCFGSGDNIISYSDIMRNLLLILISILGLLSFYTSTSTPLSLPYVMNHSIIGFIVALSIVNLTSIIKLLRETK